MKAATITSESNSAKREAKMPDVSVNKRCLQWAKKRNLSEYTESGKFALRVTVQ